MENVTLSLQSQYDEVGVLEAWQDPERKLVLTKLGSSRALNFSLFAYRSLRCGVVKRVSYLVDAVKMHRGRRHKLVFQRCPGRF